MLFERGFIKSTAEYIVLALLLFFLAMLVTEKYTAKTYVHIFMLFGFVAIILANRKREIFSKNAETIIRFGLLAYLLVLTGYFYQHPELTRFGKSVESQLGHLLPLMIFPILYWLRSYITLNFYAWCLVLASITSVFITVVSYMYVVPNLDGYFAIAHRAGGQLHGSPIIFGNLSLLFGVLAFVLSIYFYKKDKFLFVILIASGVMGLISSLLSGSRGGWIVLATLPFFIIPVLNFKKPYHLLIIYFTMLVVFVFVTLNLSESMLHRVELMIEEVNLVFSDPNYHGGSLGSRLVFWQVAWQAFISSPLLGIGAGEFYAFKQNLIIQGLVPLDLSSFKHAHNEYLSILSSYGLVGLFFYTVFIFWLFLLFKKYLKSSILRIRQVGLQGMVIIFCYLEFSLTESFLSSQLGLAAFYFLITFLIFIGESNQKLEVAFACQERNI